MRFRGERAVITNQIDNLGELQHLVDRYDSFNLTTIAKQTVVVLNFFAIAARS